MRYFFHLSFDDVICCFEELSLVKPKSIFELSFFSYIKNSMDCMMLL